MISDNGGCDKEMMHRVETGWGKLREMSGIVCYKRILIMLKVAVYKAVIRPVMMYGSETIMNYGIYIFLFKG